MNPPLQGLLALNLGSATLKAAHFHRQETGDGGLVPHGERLEVPVDALDGVPPEFGALLDRAAALLPADALWPDVVAHRIVHGGARTAPALMTDAVAEELSGYAPMAPLHQPQALALVRAAQARWPNARHVAVFDTAWHATLATWSRRLPLPQAIHDAGVMRYGFHGLAFQSAMRQLTARDPAIARQRVVLAHLGSGCSLCAVDQGRSIDTTMGLTPLDGLPMASRSGSLDPGAIFFLQRQLGMSIDAVERMLWRESGLRGLSGSSGDMRQLLDDRAPAARLAVEQFVVRVAQGIAGMAAGLGGMDAIAFSGGIGSHAPTIRHRVIDRLAWTGARIDPGANDRNAGCISAADSSATLWSIRVDEEFELALAGASARL